MNTIFFDKISISSVTRIAGLFLFIVAMIAVFKILFIALALAAGCTIVCQVVGKSSGSGCTWDADGIMSFLKFRLPMTA